ncbi:MAG: nucleotide disphospho-sugar-binding domain-containing protein [Mycobacteriaceae bacterium]
MRVALVAGPDPGHAFPAVALALRLRAAGHHPVLLTGTRWLSRVRAEGLAVRELPGLALRPGDDDADAGQRLHARSARMSTELLPLLDELGTELVVSDVLTAGGGMAAERCGLPWVELDPHPLYLPSRGLPPVGSGLAPGVGVRGRARDALLRAMTARSLRQGARHRAAARRAVGLAPTDPGPAARLVATMPALEVDRPDWPSTAHLVGLLAWDPARIDLIPPRGDAPLVLLSESTALGGTEGLLRAALDGLSGTRLVCTTLDGDTTLTDLPSWAALGPGRQAPLLAQARVTVCGGGHGMLAKSLAAGVPAVVVPGGGDQWELAQRAARRGCAVVVRPLTATALAAAVHQVLDEPRFAASARAAAATAGRVRNPVEVCAAAAR